MIAGINQMAQLGSILLVVVFLATAIAGCAGITAGLSRQRKWLHIATYGVYVNAALLTLISTLVFFSLLSNDFSIKYVWHNSDASMPWYYKLTAYWGGLDGSVLFWAWLLSLFSALAVFLNRNRHPELIAWVIAILMGILLFFVLLLVFYKQPFAVFLVESPSKGKGLNPLLQDPYMASHPPSLYIGYVSASIPFAFGLAALITGNVDDAWLQSVRRWMLLCWYFLSQGLILGMLWAYHVLGWGGYWNWDPVENAGLLPWFTATAFLHSSIIQERRGMMKVWNVLLVILTFLLTLLGTFMTRSGIVQSVHAFGEDTQLAGLFLTCIGVWIALSFGFLIYRLPLLRSRGQLDSLLSREFAFLLNNWVLLGMAFFVIIATLFPTLSEAIKQTRITVGPPFFNRWMAPFGLLLLLLTGAAPLVAWRKASGKQLAKQFLMPVLTCALTMILLVVLVPATRTTSVFLRENIRLPTGLLCFGLASFVLTSLMQEFYRGARARQATTNLGFFTSLLGVVARNRRRYGGYVIHAGIVLMFVGFAGQPYETEADVLFDKTTSKAQIGPYFLQYMGGQISQDVQRERQEEVTLQVWTQGKNAGNIQPARWMYRASPDQPPRTIVSIRAQLKDDLYVVLTSYNENTQEASIKVFVKPLVTWIWIGFAVLLFGTVIAFLPERLTRGASLVLVLFFAFHASPGFANPPNAHIAAGNENIPKPARDDTEKSLRKQLVCMCGSCGRQTLAECSCGHAAQDRALLAKLLDEGKTPSQIVDFFVAKYPGDTVLIVPPDQGLNRLAWIIPLLGTGVALGALVWTGLRWHQRKSKTSSKPSLPISQDPNLSYEKQLDQDLQEMD